MRGQAHQGSTALKARWREIFCTCTSASSDPACIGCHILRTVLKDWGTIGLRTLLRHIDTREHALQRRIVTLETQLELMKPRGFLED